MNFDFALILVVITALTGAVWVLDRILWLPGRRAAIDEAAANAGGQLPKDVLRKMEQGSGWVDTLRSMFPVLAVVLVLRSFLFEPFQIPSGSMLPTLNIGDFILVNKYHYGLRLPVAGTKVVEMNDPERGDVVVFKYPNDPSINYIKRVVGVPGDRIEYRDKVLYVNGQQQTQKLLAQLPPAEPRQLLIEENLSGVKHEIYQDIARPTINGGIVVPEGQYFVMGDNRDNSNDSRAWGFVPDELLVGKAVAVWVYWPERFSLPDFTAARAIK